MTGNNVALGFPTIPHTSHCIAQVPGAAICPEFELLACIDLARSALTGEVLAPAALPELDPHHKPVPEKEFFG